MSHVLPKVEHGPGERVRYDEGDRKLRFRIEYHLRAEPALRKESRRLGRAGGGVRRNQSDTRRRGTQPPRDLGIGTIDDHAVPHDGSQDAGRVHLEPCPPGPCYIVGMTPSFSQASGRSGYSGTPLAKKLGISAGTTMAIIGAPANYADLLAPLPEGARFTSRMPKTPELVHIFTVSRTELVQHLHKLRTRIVENGVVWVSWPKRASNVPTDITEDVIRDIAIPLGFVDVKVCAVDETWSGLKLMIRRELRGATQL